MKFDFFKSRKTRETNLEPITNSMPPEIYRGVQTYESESDRFCSFDEDYFFGEEYDLNIVHHKKRISIREPKISPTSFFGFFCGAFLVLIKIQAGQVHIGSNRQCLWQRASTVGRKSLRWGLIPTSPSNHFCSNRGNVLR